ncbi:hypothetical protein PTNB73_05776 [Pyrenophora teres f. teres]|uniref:CypX Cytochrome P450 n=1 Tax=Pyrenophora teres f. teres (strain 0-1) TaxID=861557 RepID=E3RTF3_PYRTT|nr:hypothetical protein PTT_12271 [Pyrenophora teres f. teres 0-1]KAE8829095.1 hypothetical protein PTNB85_08283 [Pyrenophora teres f. teres]KAE8864888.1 hypothetical protein PTNB73_05776 [Pyrenophora teres f. teres]
MAIPKAIAAVLLIGLTYFFKFLWKVRTSSVATLPGPWYSHYTGVVLRYHTLRARRIFYVHELHHRYGGVVRIAPNQVAVADIAGVSQIHKIGSGFLKSAWYENFVSLTGNGIFPMRDLVMHGTRRKLFSRAFSNSSLKNNWEPEVRRKVNLAVQKIKQDALDAQKGADIFKWWTLMATDVVTHLSFGESFNMVEQGKQTPYIDALQKVALDGLLRNEIPLLRALLRYIPIKTLQDVFNAQDMVFTQSMVAVRNMRNGNGSSMNLFGQIIACAEDKEKESLTEDDVKVEAGSFIIAGSDTTAVTMTYLTWAVLKQPALRARLEDEIAQLSDELTMAELEGAPVLNSVIDETLRLYCAAPGALPRVVPKGGMTVSGYHIAGGVEVSTQAYTNHRDPSVFPDPLNFDGLRFLNKAAMTPAQKTSFMPWGGGSRTCIGLHLALIEIRLATALFFRECRGAKISECMQDEMMELENTFLVAPKGHCCYVSLT